MSRKPLEPIAIVGLGLRFPGADDTATFWANLREGRVFVGPSVATLAETGASPRTHSPVARLEGVDGFDWRAFGIPPNQARYLDPQHRLLLEVVWESLEDAGIPTGALLGSRTAVYIGMQWNDYLRLQSRDPAFADSYSLTGNLLHFAANRVSHVFGLRGPSMVIDMGCASSLAAVHAACQSLRLHESDLAIAGGVELVLSPDSTAMMAQAGLLDENDECHTFDAKAAGFVRGEGVAAVVMMRAEDVKPEDRAYASVLGSAVNHNGSNPWITAPSQDAQTAVLREAWERSGISAEQLDYVELHGTASPTGDAVEAAALGAAMAARLVGAPPLRVGSVKTYIGHLGAASGIAGLVKVTLALHHGEIPPGLRFEQLNPDIPLETLGLGPQTELSPWPCNIEPPLAGVTATSLSGANAHLVLRGPRRDPERGPRLSSHEPVVYPLPLSAHSPDALRDLCRRFRNYLAESEDPVSDVSYTASVRRTHHEFRFYANGVSTNEWIAALDSFLDEGTQVTTHGDLHCTEKEEYLAGGSVDWSALLPHECRVVSLPTHPWQRQSFWLPSVREGTDAAVEHSGGLDVDENSDLRCFVPQQLAEILGVDEDEISESRSPVELGLDSLRALKLSHALETALGVSISVADILGGSVGTIVHQVNAAFEARHTETRQPEHNDRDAGVHPLSVGQQALWFHHELNQNSSVHNVILPLELKGQLDENALRGAFERVVERHPMLRVSFEAQEGKPVQHVHSRVELPWTAVDASGLSPDELEARLLQDGHCPFDLRRQPPLRIALYRSGGSDRNVILIVVHHIAIDFWSLAILLDEVGHLYLSLKSGRPPTLRPLEASYFDFVAGEREALGTFASEERLAFWRRTLTGLPERATLPFDHPRPEELSSDGASHVFTINAALTERVRRLARAQGATPFMALLAAFKLLLHREGGSSDLAVGTPTSGREQERFAGVVGYFVNPVVVRTRVEDGATFQSYVATVSRGCVDAVANKDAPFPVVVEALRVPRSKNHHPLFQVMFALQQSQLTDRQDLSAFAFCDTGAAGKLGDLEMTSIGLKRRVVQFDLNLMLAPKDDGLAATLEYNTSLFTAETATRLVQDYVGILGEMTENPLQLLFVRPSRERTLHGLFESQVELQPDGTAVIGPQGEELTFSELNRQANQMAHRLLQLGVDPGAVVGVCVGPSVDWVVCALAVLKAGAAYLPLDSSLPRERIVWMLEDARAALTITSDDLGDLPCKTMDPTNPESRSLGVERRQCSVDPQGLAYVMFTSGSTGRPKGAMVSHVAIVEQLLWRQRIVPLDTENRVLLLASPAFDISIWELFGPLVNGAKLVIAPSGARRDRSRLAELILSREITTLQLVSSALAQLIEEPLFGRCDSLKTVFCGGDEISVEVAEKFHRMSRAELVHLYGPTEAVIDAAFYRCPRTGLGDKVPIGRPVDGNELHVLDDDLAPVPRGEAGELCIGGTKLARGYVGRPELTAQQFVPDPMRPGGGRLYRTGDLVRLNESNELEFLGRRDEQVKIRGYRVELGEVEAAIGRHAAVRDSAAIARKTGTERTIVAYVVARASQDLAPNALREHLGNALPDYMVPSELVVVEELPRLPSGKVDRERLADLDARRDRTVSQGEFLSHTEEMVAGVWAELLNLECVPTAANFFELGGHSLLALQVAARLSALAGVEIPVRTVFDQQTVRELGAWIAQRELETTHGSAIPRITPVGAEEAPLSFAQEGLWLVDQLDPGGLTFTVPQAFELKGALDVAALERSFGELFLRHESLRTTFRPEGETAMQVIGRPEPYSLPFEDLASLGPDEARRAVADLVKAETHRGFDLARGPLFRAALVRIADDEHALLLNTHHIISDGWSQALLLGQLGELYRSVAAGESPPLGNLGLQYADYAGWERAWLAGERLDRLLSYWVTKLRGARSAPLPMELRAAKDADRRGAFCSSLIDASTTAQLRALCRDENATLFMGLVAVFAVLLNRYGGETDLIVGTPMSVRDRPELESIAGIFVNMLPLRISIARTMTFRELLAAVREESLTSYAHRQLPFGRIVKELQPERREDEIPLLSVVFQFVSQPAGNLDLGDVTVSSLLEEVAVTRPYLDMIMALHNGGLEARLSFPADRFELPTIAGMLDWYARILGAIVAQPTTRLATILSSLERSDTGGIDDAVSFNFEREDAC